MKTRREFLVGAACALGGAAGCCNLQGAARAQRDSALSVFISDLHISGTLEKFAYSQKYLTKALDAILAMDPLPQRVIGFGDVAVSYGLAADYAAAKPILQRIEDAGIELYLTMGNHDRRSTFLQYWPEYGTNQLVKGRFTRVISVGSADLVLLDALKGTDDRPIGQGPVEGTLDPAQLAWFESFVAQAKRPFFVGSHQFRDLYIDGEKPISRAAKSKFFAGWIYGHDHSWCPDIHVASWQKHIMCPTLALPSVGFWGDIGYVCFRTDETGATASLVQSDFFFQTPTAHTTRPTYWDVRVRDNQGQKMRFAF